MFKMKILNFLLIFLCAFRRQVAAENMMADNTDRTWWQHAVFYQIYPRSFMDLNGDGIGDLPGITMKLPYLVETGIEAIWLSPIFKSPMTDFGYDISDFQAIHEEYGTMEDFDLLMAEANRLGIKVLLDFVPNHTSDECEWFKKSMQREPGFEDFYIWADGRLNEKGEREPPNNWQSLFYGSAWEWNEIREQYYLHQFTIGQPDLNYRNPNVVSAMDEVLNFWLNKGVSGFRVDAVNHLFEIEDLRDEPLSGKTADKHSYEYTEHIYTKNLPEVLEMLHHWRNVLDDYTASNGGPERILLTEAYAPLKLLMQYYETDAGIPGSHVPFNFNLITDLNENSDARDFVYNIQKWLIYMPPGNERHVANWVLGNHDNPRVASRFAPQLVDALNMMILTLPGIAVTYNGEEIGMADYRDISWEQTVDPPARNVGPKHYKEVSRDPVRTPFQWNSSENAGFSSGPRTWLPINPNYVNLNLETQLRSPKSHYKVYKKLIETRAHPVLMTGKCEAKVLSRHVFAIKRELYGHGFIATIINLSAEPQTVALNEFLNYPQVVNILVAGTNSTRDNGAAIDVNLLDLEPYEGLVCESGLI